jgi:hypothetical protein
MSSDNDLDNKAIYSMIAGVAALIFALGGNGTFLHFLSLVGGLAAVGMGLPVLRSASSNKKMAVTGAVTGTIAVAIWLLTFTAGMIAWAWHLVWH